MDPVADCILKTQQLIKRVEAIHHAVAVVHSDLRKHLEALRKLIPAAAAVAAAPVPGAQPAPPSAAAPPARSGKKPPSDSEMSAAECRIAARRTANRVVITLATAVDDSEPFAGWVVDYSPSGLGIEVDRLVAVGSFVQVRPAGFGPLVDFPWVEAEVRHRRQDGKSWRLGCQLDQPLSWDQLRLFGFA